MIKGSYGRADFEQKVRNLIGEKMIAMIPQEEWDAFDEHVDFLSELHTSAMRKAHEGTLRVKEYEDFLRTYDAHMQKMMRGTNLFAGNNGTTMADLFGDFRHFTPFYLVFDNFQTKLLFLILVKIFYSFIKDYGEDGPNSGTIGNQVDLPNFLASNK